MKIGEIRYLDGLEPDSIVIDGLQKQASFKLPIAISYLLDVQVGQVNAGLDERGEKMTSRSEMVAMHVAAFSKEAVNGLSILDRLVYYREMTISELGQD